MIRRHSSAFFALLGVPLIGVVLVHLPSATTRAGIQRSASVASGPVVAPVEPRLQAMPGSQPNAPVEEFAMAGSPAAVGGLATTQSAVPYALRGTIARRGTPGSVLPLASVFVLFAAGGLLLLRRIARMMV